MALSEIMWLFFFGMIVGVGLHFKKEGILE